MGKQTDYMLKIIKYGEEHDAQSSDIRRLTYLFDRFFKELESAAATDAEFVPLILRLAEIAQGKESRLKLFYYSFLAKITKDVSYINAILKMCMTGEIKSLTEINFIRWQCEVLVFLYSGLATEEYSYLSYFLYKEILNRVYKHFKSDLRFIYKDKRNKENVVVITSQFLNLSHGPTKTLLARCSTLKNVCGMNVFIINTTEHLTPLGQVPFYKAVSGNVCEEYSSSNKVYFEDEPFGYYQPSVPMPDLDEIKRILFMVYDQNPYFIVNIGGNSLTADLCAKIAPVITIGTVPSAIPTTCSQFRTVGRALTKKDIKWLDKMGIDRDSVIESVFTSNFRKQTKTFSRKDFNLPEDKFLAMVVGWRLNYEIDASFLHMMENTFDDGICYVFIGVADNIQKLAERDISLSKYCYFLGKQEELLALAEICDLYVNPKRTGGGTSCVEAMSKGVPVVTLPLGDVAVNAGVGFAVENYDEMANTITRYKNDEAFYTSMSKAAYARAETLQDTDKEFKALIDKIIASRLFK